MSVGSISNSNATPEIDLPRDNAGSSSSSVGNGNQPNQATIQEAAAVLDQLVNGSSSLEDAGGGQVGSPWSGGMGGGPQSYGPFQGAGGASPTANPQQALQLVQTLLNDLSGGQSAPGAGLGGPATAPGSGLPSGTPAGVPAPGPGTPQSGDPGGVQNALGAAVGTLATAAQTASPAGSGPAQMPQPTDTRPPGDTRSADQIVADNPTLANLGNQEHVMDNLKKQCGDWTDPNLTPDQRADAAYRASGVLNYIKSSSASDGSARSSNVTDDGKIDGFTKDGQARHGTEAGALKDFGEQGYSALSPTDSLDTTSDKYVNKDGTTKSDGQVIGSDILGGLQKAFGFLGDIASFVGGLHIPLISEIADGAAVVDSSVSGAAGVGKAALDGGDVKQAGIDMGIGIAGAVAGAIAPGAGKAVTGVADVAARVGKEGAKQAAGQVASSIPKPSSDSSNS